MPKGLTTSRQPPQEIDGFKLALNGGAPSAGDSFKITPTRNAAAKLDTVLTDPKRIALAAPLSAVSGSGNQGTGVITQPELTSKLDIYDSTQRIDLQNGLKYSTPVKLVLATKQPTRNPTSCSMPKAPNCPPGPLFRARATRCN